MLESKIRNRKALSPLVRETYDVNKVPRSLYMSSNMEDRSLEKVRDKLRNNVFQHKKFDPFLASRYGAKYFAGVYSLNQTNTSFCKGEETSIEEAKDSFDIMVPVHVSHNSKKNSRRGTI